ncbi:N-acetylneuraminate synthase [Aquirufa antheringensis]|uniref:N-acetylneuraminate synthase n=1 Tax=Aquirufa antheringensis TaxID=2516559 RepID=A0A4Q9BFQ1_9BACT|nr:N-acetylneuraminate synthase [Aquirufa antheringensis]TBH75069.1 N-acetylneuraminate synthase [Aquirufa antheringensis]
MNKVIIIAEAGVNHNGDIELAKKLIDVAVEAGVDYVKFQTFKSESLVSKFAKKASYQIENTKDAAESQLQMLKKLELSNTQHFELVKYCNNKNISFFSTAFDLESLSFLKELGLNIVKIPSGEITNLPYLRKAAALFKEVIISTGMSSMVEIEEALNVFLQAGILKNDITILHCNTEYPTPMSDVNLNAMLAIQKMFGVKVGYSDHTMGIEVPIAAVALGGTMIEKHFTLDRSLPGPDQLASLEPDELKNMVYSIRNIEKAIGGTGIKEPSESEIKNISIARKSIVAKTSIQKGDRFTEFNITTKRPGIGLSPMKWDEVIGKVACQDFDEDELIKFGL